MKQRLDNRKMTEQVNFPIENPTASIKLVIFPVLPALADKPP